MRRGGAPVQPRRSRRSASERRAKPRARGAARGVCIAVAVGVALLAAGFLDRDTGLGHWLDLRRDLAAANARIAALRASIAAREDEARALREDPLAIEAAIRSDLGLARPGEWVVRDQELTSLRNP